ncbi:MAG: hypothetical protein MUO40_04660, partial [Anaerolineaceae bacterium]|nr:hypothetical protein [Anaerolineaceae bacterium]
MQKQIIGQKNQWTLLEQVGKGDAGEVYKVTSPDHSIIAVLKRPSRNATGGSIIRQAVQIENEGRILAILNGIQIKQNKFNLLTPLLLDESDPKTTNTSKYFIISQQAEGESLSELLSKARIKRNVFPRELLLKVITSLFSLFENIHLKGVLWND